MHFTGTLDLIIGVGTEMSMLLPKFQKYKGNISSILNVKELISITYFLTIKH